MKLSDGESIANENLS